MHEDFSRKLKLWRVQNGLNQQALATKLGVSQVTISRWEREIDAPTPRHMREITGLLDKWSLQHDLEIERIGISNLTTPRAIFDADGLKLLAWSGGFAQLWPKNHQGKKLDYIEGRYLLDDLVNEVAQIVQNDETARNIGKGNIVAMSCVTNKSTMFEDNHSYIYRMHGVVRMLGSKSVIDVTYEPIASKDTPRVEPILFRP